MPLDTETAITGRQVAKLAAGAPVVGIVPTTIEEAFRLAELVTQSGLAPEALKTPQAVTVVLLKGLEVGLPPMAALETIGVIKNKACLFGDAVPTLLWSRGFKIKEWYEGEGDKLVARCTITRPDGTEITGEYSVAEAKVAGLWGGSGDRPWAKHPRRMLKMRARIWTARDAASDVLKGMPVFEEQRDMMDVTPDGPTLPLAAAPQVEDIPDEADKKADAQTDRQAPKIEEIPAVEASQKADKRAVLSDQEFKDKIDEAYATASDLSTLNEHMVSFEMEIEERGLEQECANIYRKHMDRIYDRM